MIAQGPMAGQMPQMQQGAAPMPQIQNNPNAMQLLKQYGMNKALQAGVGMMPGGPLAQGAAMAVAPALGFQEGGKININPAHKGQFTAKAKAAGEGVQEYASKVLSAPEGRYPASTRRQANFAKNAAAWHKNDGGRIGADTYGSPAIYREEGGGTESNWAKMMRQWKELKAAMADEELQQGMANVAEGLGTTAGQQQLMQAVAPLAVQMRNSGGRIGADTYGSPAVFRNMGGPLGGGQTKKGLEEARKLGALTQEEFLKAMAHGGYLNYGGKVSGVKYKRQGGKINEEAHVTFHGPLNPKGE